MTLKQVVMQWADRVGRAIRTAWLLTGLSLALLVGVEMVYRGQAALRKAIAQVRKQAVPSPYTAQPWFREYETERVASIETQWEPYVYWRRLPYEGRYITIDSGGHRRTIQPVSGAQTGHVFFFGGSTMWGTYQRDSMTIPSGVAARLAERGLTDVRITNYGETGYVFTQEVFTLLLELRKGLRPDLVVFYDGINDVAAAVIDGRAGMPQNEANRVADFRLGRTLAASHDWQALSTLGLLAIGRLQFLQRLKVRKPNFPLPSPDSLARDLVDTYARTVELVEALSRAYGFRVLYIWQPALHTTLKLPTPFERSLVAQIESDSFQSRLRAVHRAALHTIDSAMLQVAPGAFLNLSGSFARDTATVYLDLIGHTTEAANEIIVKAMFDLILTLLKKPVSRASRN